MPKTYQIVWYQSLLMLAGLPLDPEVLERNITSEAEAKVKLEEWKRDLQQPGNGVVVAMRETPEE